MAKERSRSETAYVGLGTNMGNRVKNLVTALQGIESSSSLSLGLVSSIYETKPIGVHGGGMFLNAVCSVDTHLVPRALLDILEGVEFKMGRRGKGKCESRIIDLDLLLHGDLKLKEPGLILPHPRLHERGFVLVPLCEIAPRAFHPVLGKRICDILLDLGEEESVRFYSRFPEEESAQE